MLALVFQALGIGALLVAAFVRSGSEAAFDGAALVVVFCVGMAVIEKLRYRVPGRPAA